MTSNRRYTRRILLGATALAGAFTLGATQASAQDRLYDFDVPAQPLNAALQTFARQAQLQVIFAESETKNLRAPPLAGSYSADEALQRLLAGTQLTVSRTNKGVLQIAASPAPQGGSAAGGGAEVEALIVTAQKREEDIQDVPIAISAFTQEALEKSQIAGGPDLMTQVPNMTFTKTNFTGYSISIRGIGTQAISATTDPAVAVAFNNTPFIRNRFFEQEFFDLQRVEVLRGPQGTLYGRNATAGVVNLISAKPKFNAEAKLSADVGNYKSKRLEGMVNIPLVEDMVALRLAGAWTKRDGYATNAFTGNPIDGRDLWSTRATLRFAPTDALDVNLIWEHFEEDDDRIRSGKQACKKHVRTDINGIPMPVEIIPGTNSSPSATYHQGCLPASVYAEESFQTPNGFALPYIHPLSQVGLPVTRGLDPYASQIQSLDLRTIESVVDPTYRAISDIFELQVSWDIADHLSIQSETAYSTDELFSTQDYNRFITSTGIFDQAQYDAEVALGIGLVENILNDGFFCDPQIGCSDRLVAMDLSSANSTNFSQELRLASDYDGPLNFSVGANFTRYDTIDKYYVFINSLSLFAAMRGDAARTVPAPVYQPGVTSNADCLSSPVYGDPTTTHPIEACIYIDPNPIGSLNDQGHNYFLSNNPYRLVSYAVFGESYLELSENLKVTAGLRYTVDRKRAPLVPSWLLAAQSVGYPVKETLDLEWREPSGRLAIDWKPDLSFTDQTLLYASYAHGYKAGGANPPPMAVVAGQLSRVGGAAESVLHPKTFDAEYVDAFEIGAKNTLLDGQLTVNTSAFYYDYVGYQISQIIDRSAVNSNFDADIWGAEVEIDWRPIENLRLGFKGGYENTRLADGSKAIDLMDRTAGNPDWIVAKPFPSLASNCVLPVWLVTFNNRISTQFNPSELGDIGYCAHAYIEGLDPVTRQSYVPNPTLFLSNPLSGTPIPLSGTSLTRWGGYPGFDPSTAPNNGEGFEKDLSGNELPNAPHFTGTLTADYSVPLRGDWLLNLHADLYYQSEAWTRIFNTEGYDKLKAYTNVNLAATLTNEEAGWKVMAYVKNVMDRDSITGAFLNSDDSGLTTNVFLTEPRLFGVRVTKDFADAPLLGSLFGDGSRSVGGRYPITLEFGGGPARYSADTEAYAPDWLALYSDEFPGPDTVNEEDLDWGDKREVKLTYAPAADWRVSAAYRFGRTNGSHRGAAYEEVPTTSYVPLFGTDIVVVSHDPNHWIEHISDREEYEIVDFAVGKEVGFGAFGEGGKSTVSAGIRHARFSSSSEVAMDGVPVKDISEFGSVFDESTLVNFIQYTHGLQSERSFEGYGPHLSWEATIRLFGREEAGHVDLDWSVGAGVLFGQQEVESSEDQLARYFRQNLNVPKSIVYDIQDIATSRSQDVEVPNVSLSLGLSYTLDRVKVSTGYGYDRYFDVIDGGIDETRQSDRTVHGPFVKLSFGFGQ